MAPYLATATNGVFELRVSSRIKILRSTTPGREHGRGRGGNGAVRSGYAAEAPEDHPASSPASTAPYRSAHGRRRSVDHAPDVGYALESQTKSMYDDTRPGASTVVARGVAPSGSATR